MKKILIFATSLLFFAPNAFGLDYTCPTTYDLSSGFSRAMSVASGSNFIHKTLLENYLEKKLRENIKGDFNIKIDSFSGQDLKEGKFKSLSATGENIEFGDFSISSAKLNSICSFNRYVKTPESKFGFEGDFPATLTLELTADNINSLAKTKEYQAIVRKLNQLMRGMLRIEGIKFEVSEGRLWYNIVYSTPFMPKRQAFRVGTTLSMAGAENPQISGKSAILNLLNMVNALNFINPLDFSTKIIENSNINAEVTNIHVNGDKVILDLLVNISE